MQGTEYSKVLCYNDCVKYFSKIFKEFAWYPWRGQFSSKLSPSAPFYLRVIAF